MLAVNDVSLNSRAAVAKVQKKGQVTIPIHIRRIFDIVDGGFVKFELNDREEVTISPVVIAEARSAVSTVENYLKENDISAEELNRISEAVQERIFEEMYGDL